MKNKQLIQNKDVTKTQILSTQQEFMNSKKQCRICLEEEQNNQKVISPCKCSGTMTYVHQKCMKQWICKKHDNDNKQGLIECELCKQNITFQFHIVKRCNNCQQIKQAIQEQPKLFIFLLIITVINLSFLIFLIIVISEDVDTDSTSQHQIVKVSILSCAIFSLLVVLFLGFLILIREFFVNTIKQITKINQIKNDNSTNNQSNIKVRQKQKTDINDTKDITRIIGNINLYQFDIQ